MSTPYITIDPAKIESNARVIVDYCRARGVRVAGVVKCVRGFPEIGRAMLRGGAACLADSRLENIRRLRAAGIDAPLMMLRVPALSQAREVVEWTDCSLNSEIATLRALSRAAVELGKRHDVVLMVELGDLREGIPPAELDDVARRTANLPGLCLKGLGANLACFGGVAPDENNMRALADLAANLEATLDMRLEIVSGLNSSALEFMESGLLPANVNHARMGESILLGRETLHRRPWPGTVQDAFVIYAEILELKTKPSSPVGSRAEDAFGGRPRFEDRGLMRRALLNIGREDVDISGLRPLDERLKILGASSGYLVLDASAGQGPALKVGDEIAFYPAYGALLAAMTSEYVKKVVLRDGEKIREESF